MELPRWFQKLHGALAKPRHQRWYDYLSKVRVEASFDMLLFRMRLSRLHRSRLQSISVRRCKLTRLRGRYSFVCVPCKPYRLQDQKKIAWSISLHRRIHRIILVKRNFLRLRSCPLFGPSIHAKVEDPRKTNCSRPPTLCGKLFIGP